MLQDRELHRNGSMSNELLNELREAICDTAYALSLNPNECDHERDIVFLAMLLNKYIKDDTDDNNN